MTNAIEILDRMNVKPATIEVSIGCVAGQCSEDLRLQNSVLILPQTHDDLKNLVNELMNIVREAE